MTRTSTADPPDRLARALGLVSLTLGLPQVAAPAAVLRAAGLPDDPTAQLLARAVGGRELLSAAGLLTPAPHPSWVWTRVLGDAVDLTVLGRAVRGAEGGARQRRLAATALVAGVTLLDLVAAARARRAGRAVRVEATGTTTVRADPRETYRVWRRFADLPGSWHTSSRSRDGTDHVRWTRHRPVRPHRTWDAETTERRPGRAGRLALGRRHARRQRGRGPLHPGARRPRHRGARPPGVLRPRRRARAGRGPLVGRGAAPAARRRPAALQAGASRPARSSAPTAPRAARRARQEFPSTPPSP